MSQIAYLEAIVGADITSFRRGMAQVRSEITQTTGLGESLQGIGTALTLGLTVPIVGLGVAAVKTFTDFDANMRNVNSIMHLSEDMFGDLEDQVRQFGQETRNGIQGASEALYTIVSAGFGINDTAQAMQVLAVASKTAEAGLADENITAQVLAQSLLAYGKNADSAAHFSDVLTQTVNLGVGTMDDVAGSMGQVINSAALAGVSFDELGGSAAFLTQRGMSFANAFTSLNAIIGSLLKPNKALKAVLDDMGVTGTELIQKFGGLGGALEALQEHIGGTPEKLAEIFGNIRAFRGVASILGNFDAFNSTMQNFGESVNGVTDRAQQEQLKSFASQFDYLKSAVGGFLEEIGRVLAPILGDAAKTISALAVSFANLAPQTIENVVKIGLLVAAIGPLVWLIGTLLSPIGLLIGLVALLADAWSNNFLGIRDSVTQAIPNILKGFNDLHLALINVYTFFGDLVYQVKSIFDQYFAHDMVQLIHDVIIGNWARVPQDLANIWKDIQKLVQDKLAKPLNDAIDSIKRKIGEFLSTVTPDQFTAIAVGILSIAGVLLIANIPALIGLISDAFLLLSTNIALVIGIGGGGGLIALGATLLPFIAIIGVIIGLVWAWQNNFLGIKDAINEVGTALKNWMTDPAQHTIDMLKQIIFLTTYYTQGAEAARKVLADQFGMKMTPTNSAGYSASQGPAVPNTGGFSMGVAPTGNYADIGRASGYSNTTTHNNVQIVTNDPQIMLEQLRRAGVDIGRYQRS